MPFKQGGVIASGDPLTSQAGCEILKAGGNAYDAAVGATLMSFVAGSAITSAGGGGFMLAMPYQKRATLFDFFTQTPKHKGKKERLDFYPVTLNFGDSTQTFHIGLASAAVPGNFAGLFHVHRRLGKIPFREIAIPAIEAAKNGVTVTSYIHNNINLVSPVINVCDTSRSIYLPDGKALAIGEKYALPYFSDLLEYMADNGVREFYEGEVAQRIVKDAGDLGGYLTMDDFRSFEVYERKPLSLNYRGFEILTNPPPSAGGVLIAFMLKLLEQVSLSNFDYGSPGHLENLVKVMLLSNRARADKLDGHGYKDDVLAQFLSDDHLRLFGDELLKNKRTPGNTTHVTVVDNEYNIATVTTSFGEGSGYTVPGTNIMLNNMLGEEDLNPQGFHRWPENQRITSMMSPTIVLDRQKPFLAMGSGGANRIKTAILQVITNLIDFSLPLSDAVNNGRIHCENNMIDIEPGIDPSVIDSMAVLNGIKKNYFERKSMYFGGVHCIKIDDGGGLVGAGDQRREGAVLSC
ncbi:gamma-glutamyltransferase [Fulvivirgaceae bacterium BMA12]|uniref:Glutathione hydrolase proenzyme n=1 Tax=Agaribacillus aureus TaxID=3051825 RepID=A0ABT8L3U1_9BACT|nr:gamma-glutamyltransferase [Fulvivirgaceae bacterium BMA12]